MFSIIILLFSGYTIYHMWHHVPSSKGWRILVAVGLLLMSLLGVVAYWVYYFIAKPNRNGMDDEKKAGGNASEAEAIVAELTATYENEELDTMARLDEMAKIISRKILVTTFDVGRKCRLLEAVNAYTEQLDASLHNYIHGMAIYNSFCVIEALTQSLIFQEEKSEFLKKVTDNTLTDYKQAYCRIMGVMGSIAQNGKSFTSTPAMFDGYNIPVVR